MNRLNEVKKKRNKYWERQEYPKELSRIKSRFDWEEYPAEFKEKWYDYIDEEFKRREQGYWFYNNGDSYLYYWYSLHVLTMVKDRRWSP